MILRPMIRRAFSLAELLVVIGIMLLLLGLSAGAFLRTTRINKVLATEHLIADMLRQARHTARTTGTPVMIEILAPDPDKAGTIAGVSQVPIWNYAFEDLLPPNPQLSDLPLPDPKWLIETGHTGKALRLLPAIPPDQPLSPSPYSFPRDQRLQRKDRNKKFSGGFYISCRVRPSLARNGQTWLPLILIGESGARVDASVVGLALRRNEARIQVQANVDSTKPDFKPMLANWEIVGWINGPRDDTSKNNQVRSIDDDVQIAQQAFATSDTDPNGPIIGGSWVEIGLLYNSRELALFRDGVLVAQFPAASVSPAPSLPAPGPTRMVSPELTPGIIDNAVINLAHMIEPANSTDPETPYFLTSAELDDVRIFRLGTDQPTALPAGMRPVDTNHLPTSYHILIRPDGRVDGINGPLIFESPNDSTESAIITIAPEGAVTNSQTKLDVRP